MPGAFTRVLSKECAGSALEGHPGDKASTSQPSAEVPGPGGNCHSLALISAVTQEGTHLQEHCVHKQSPHVPATGDFRALPWRSHHFYPPHQRWLTVSLRVLQLNPNKSAADTLGRLVRQAFIPKRRRTHCSRSQNAPFTYQVFPPLRIS